MKFWLSVYGQELKTTIASQLQYRVALVIWLLGHVLEPVIYLVVWSTVARGSGGSVGGLTSGDFAAYFVVLMVVNHVTFSWIMWEYDYRIRQGTLSAALLRPIHPIHADIADNLAFKAITLNIMLPTAVLLGLAFQARLAYPGWWAYAAFVPVLVLAFVTRFVIEWTLAMSAFWTTRISAINQMYYVAALFFSGQIAPLSLLPYPVQVVTAFMPFRWLAAFPVDLFLGHLTLLQTLEGLAAQVVWLGIGYGLLRIVWRAGVRRYSAVGA